MNEGKYLYYANGFKNSDMPSHWPAGMARVIVPSNVDMDAYIKTCFSTYTVSICTYNMEIIHKVKVSKQAMDDIEFPTVSDNFGSIVFYVRTLTTTLPFIVATFKPDAAYSALTAGTQISVVRNSGNNLFKFFVDAATGSSTFTLRSDSSTTYTVEVLNSQNLAVYTLSVQGVGKVNVTDILYLTIGNRLNINIYNPQQSTSQKATIDYTLGTGFTYVDEFNNSISINKSGLTYTDALNNNFTLGSNGLKFFNGADNTQTIALGDTTSQLLTQLNQNILALIELLLTQASTDATVATGLGMPGLATLSSALPTIINNLMALNFNTLKSENSKVN